MEIELVNPIPELVETYKAVVTIAIRRGLITLEEWNTKYKHYRDEIGYSMIHYLECCMNGIGNFCTKNKLMLENRKELQDRFGVSIMTLKEMMDFQKQ